MTVKVEDDETTVVGGASKFGTDRWQMTTGTYPFSHDDFILQRNGEAVGQLKRIDPFSESWQRKMIDLKGPAGEQELFHLKKKPFSILEKTYCGVQAADKSQLFSLSQQTFKSGLRFKGKGTLEKSKAFETFSAESDSAFNVAKIVNAQGVQLAEIRRHQMDAKERFLQSNEQMREISPALARHADRTSNMQSATNQCVYTFALETASLNVFVLAAIAVILEASVRGNRDSMAASGGVGRIGG